MLFPDGIVFVDLAPLGDAVLVLSTVSPALSLRLTGDQPLLEVLQARLRRRGCSYCSTTSSTCLRQRPKWPYLWARVRASPCSPRVERTCTLGGGETVPVPPLRCPTPPIRQDVEAVAESPAARLFIERARETSLSFELTQANAHQR